MEAPSASPPFHLDPCRGVVGEKVRREKALDFSGCKDKEGPPAKPLLGAVAYHRNDGNDITPRSREYKMKLRSMLVLVIALAAPLYFLHAQDDCGDECRINSNLAMVVNVPVNPAAQVIGTGWGMVGGAGYNFDKRNAVIGEETTVI